MMHTLPLPTRLSHTHLGEPRRGVHHKRSEGEGKEDEEGYAVCGICQAPSQSQLEEDGQNLDQVCQEAKESDGGAPGVHPGMVPLRVRVRWGRTLWWETAGGACRRCLVQVEAVA